MMMHSSSVYATESKKFNIGTVSKPVRTMVKETKINQLLADPENTNGHNYLRGKYMLPKPNQVKYGRAQGAISNTDLEKLGIGTIRCKKVA